jgi:hypothetical protein
MIAIISANMGRIDDNPKHAKQSTPVDFISLTDENFPLRHCSFTPRMQARIPKCFAWQMFPDYEYYIWIDSSMTMIDPDAVKWLLEKLGDADFAFFKHPDRDTLQEECDFIKKKLLEKNYYLTPRYKNEWFDEFMDSLDKDYVDDLLIADTYFIFRNTPKVQEMMKDWWYYISRYNSNDQLGLPYVLKKYKCKFNLIDEHYMKTKHFKYTGHAK